MNAEEYRDHCDENHGAALENMDSEEPIQEADSS